MKERQVSKVLDQQKRGRHVEPRTEGAAGAS